MLSRGHEEPPEFVLSSWERPDLVAHIRAMNTRGSTAVADDLAAKDLERLSLLVVSIPSGQWVLEREVDQDDD